MIFDYEQRVLDEALDLSDKIMKLSSFIESDKFQDIVKDEETRLLLKEQAIVMCDYYLLLCKRIYKFDFAIKEMMNESE